MAVVVVSALCIINLLLWFLFFKKFTKLFSTDDIIQNTRQELNRMIQDVNRNADRDITLIDDRIKALKEIIAEADRHIAVAKSEKEKKSKEQLYTASVQNASETARAAQQYKRTSMPAGLQSDLFAAEPAPKVIGPAVHVSENPVIIKKDFTAQVQERFAGGQTIEEIAAALSSSITEVQFALDMSES